jgi:hypothetical protein
MPFNWKSIVEPSGSLVVADQLNAFEAELGFVLPDDYRAFLLSVNGGNVLVDHDIYSPELSCDVGVNYLWPLTAKHPFIGIKESRDLQTKNRIALRQATKIGDDMGTGFFFLMLDGPERGAIYFSFKDDLPMLEGDWYSKDVRIPDGMVRICSTFDDLGRLIVENKV